MSSNTNATFASNAAVPPTVEPPLSPIQAAIKARIAAKKAAAAKPRPPPGRKAQELDVEAGPRTSRTPGTTRQTPFYPRSMSK